MSTYYLSLHDLNGNQTNRFSDFISLHSRQVVNGIGFIDFTIYAAHPAVANIGHLTQVRLYRKNRVPAITWRLENYGLVLYREWLYNPSPQLRIIALHPNWLLSTRHVDWKAGTLNRSVFYSQPAETIAKTLVAYNLTPQAAADNGRERDGFNTSYLITIQDDSAAGATLDWHCAYCNLLETLQTLALVGGGDFNLEPNGDNFLFKWYSGQLGTDRSASVLFSISRGNIANPRYLVDRREEKTVAIVGGPGEGILRYITHRSGNDYAVDNDIEAFVYAAHILTDQGLTNYGDHFIAKHQARPTLLFKVIQTHTTFYGSHYFLGDLVSVQNPFLSITATYKVNAIEIILQPQQPAETIKAELVSSTPLEINALNALYVADYFRKPEIDGHFFTTTDYRYTLDAGTFADSYLIEGVDGGIFAPTP